MKQKIIIDTILLNGKETNVYVCDRKAKCKNSKLCGNECTRTFDEKHAVYLETDEQKIERGLNNDKC